MVKLQVGGQIIDLPVEAAPLGRDADKFAGGFFLDGEVPGILVSSELPQDELRAQIERACEAAMHHYTLTRKN